MNYDTPYVIISSKPLNGIGVIDPASAAIITEIANQLGPFLAKLGITNDNGVIAARDKIAQYVTQVLGNRDAAYKQLYTGFQLSHDDINNVGTTSYYVGVLKRLTEAVTKYILEHSRDSNVIFGEDVDPQVTLDRFVAEVKAGKPVDHAFWIAFTGRKDPYDIRTGNSLPATVKPTTDYKVLTDAAGVVTQVRDMYGNLVQPGTPQYNQAIEDTKQAGFFSNPSNIAIAMVGGALLLSGIAYYVNKNKTQK